MGRSVKPGWKWETDKSNVKWGRVRKVSSYWLAKLTWMLMWTVNLVNREVIKKWGVGFMGNSHDFAYF